MNETANVSPMCPLIKDHKPVAKGELPQTKPVVSYQNGMNIYSSNIISEVSEPLADRVGMNEVRSSEDMLASIDDLNLKLKDIPGAENLVLVGGDTEGPYHNLQKDISAKICGEEILNIDSDFDFDDLDWQEMGPYLWLNMTAEEHEEWKIKYWIPHMLKRTNKLTLHSKQILEPHPPAK